jgi:nucleoside-diphosphate-sugar epimerase
MRILVTGHRGLVGGPVAGLLRDQGHDVVGFDLADREDLLDPAAVRRAAEGCAATARSLELASRLAPGVPVTDPGRYRADPWRALVDCSAAEATLGWRPAHRWPRG